MGAAGKPHYTVFPKDSITSLASKMKANPDYARRIERDIEFEKREIKFSKTQGKLPKKSRGDSEEIIQRIVSILRILETEGPASFAGAKIANKLVSIAGSEHNIEKRLKNPEFADSNLEERPTGHLNLFLTYGPGRGRRNNPCRFRRAFLTPFVAYILQNRSSDRLYFGRIHNSESWISL